MAEEIGLDAPERPLPKTLRELLSWPTGLEELQRTGRVFLTNGPPTGEPVCRILMAANSGFFKSHDSFTGSSKIR